MFKNYFKTAIRNLARQKVPAIINVCGLSAGIACFSLFMLYAVNEFNYDNFHSNGANIYRVYLWHKAKGSEDAHGDSYHPMPLAPAMKQDLPGVENYVRLREARGESFIKTDSKVARGEISFADPSFFSVFSFRLKSGSPATALKDLHSIVLTEATAENLFGKTNPVGKIIEIKTDDRFEPFTVTAIAANPPSNSSIQFKMLGNFNYIATTPMGARRVNNWNQYSYQTYVQLKQGSHLASDKNTLIAFRKKYYPDEESKSRKDGWKGQGPRNHLGLQPLRAIHTDTKIAGGFVAPVDPKTIWILLGIAAGVLLIACINFTTLAIGRSASRSKEVGIRKVIGGSKKSLIKQFLTEALLLTFISTVFGLILTQLLLPFFNALSAKDLNFSITQFPQLAWLLIGVIIVVGLLAGSYPALVLSGFKPVEVLKTKVKLGGSNIFTRSLVTLQFVLSAGLIISTIIILQQLNYMQSKYPGFNRENIIVVDANGISNTKNLYALFKQKLAAHPEILGTASAELGLGGGEGWSQSMFKYNGNDKTVYEYFVDPDYMHVLGMKLIAGRNFDPAIASDTVTSVIINEAMMNDFGWTLQNATGQKLKGYLDDENDPKTPIVIGVAANFNYLPFSNKIEPQMFQQFASYAPYKFFVRIQPGDPSRALATLQSAWKGLAPDYPLKYSFLDDDLDKFYKSEIRWSNIVAWAGGISIFLACLGLFGLAALAATNRTKEIGIRKVLGASPIVVIGLLSKAFLKLIVVALLIATPLAWYFMNKWLEDFAYRIHISWWVFVSTGGLTVVIALAVISFQSIKAAVVNPVKSLRSE
ncbi:MAG TPA: ABC transporter permease [Chitinophagaceae bacterium]